MFCQSRPISQNVQDSPTFSSMNVHWSLRGFTIHTTVLALCLCGILHRDLDLADRCENCITGFLLLDIFKILARELCEGRHRHAPFSKPVPYQENHVSIFLCTIVCFC